MSTTGLIRTLIVDDEELGRERLRTLLAKEQRIELVGEAGDGKSAVAAIEKLKPELVFLDVQMPELNGFEVLQASVRTDAQRLFRRELIHEIL